MEQFINKVAESGIITLDLAAYLPNKDSIVPFDITPFLFREMILKEKDFRAALPTHDWSVYKGKNVAVFCSADAIVPVWAFMLATAYLQPIAHEVYFGTAEELEKYLMLDKIKNINQEEYSDKRVVIKGCGDTPIPDYAYVAITHHLRGVVKSIMYGEPCSTVPVYKKPATPRVAE